jgi:hypothetical protein
MVEVVVEVEICCIRNSVILLVIVHTLMVIILYLEHVRQELVINPLISCHNKLLVRLPVIAMQIQTIACSHPVEPVALARLGYKQVDLVVEVEMCSINHNVILLVIVRTLIMIILYLEHVNFEQHNQPKRLV